MLLDKPRSSREGGRSSASRSAPSIGFVLGACSAQSRVLQRGFLPYVVASQTVPILAIAPMVVSASAASALAAGCLWP